MQNFRRRVEKTEVLYKNIEITMAINQDVGMLNIISSE